MNININRIFLLIGLNMLVQPVLISQINDSTWFREIKFKNSYGHAIDFLEIDKDSNLILAGEGIPDYENSSGTIYIVDTTYAFISKLDRESNEIWTSLPYSIENDSITQRGIEIIQIKIGTNNNIHIAGRFKGIGIFGDYIFTAEDWEGFYAVINQEGDIEYSSMLYYPFDNRLDEFIPEMFEIINENNIVFLDKDYLIRTDKYCNILWYYEFDGGIRYPSITNIDNCIYLFARFDGEVIIGNDTLVSMSGSIGWDSFLAKLDLKNNFIWVNQFSNRSIIFPISIVSIQNKYVLLSGGFADTIFYRGDTLVDALSDERNPSFLIATDTAGNLEWWKVNHIYPYYLKSYQDNAFWGSIHYDEFNLNHEWYTTNNQLVLINYNPTGDINWLKSSGGNIGYVWQNDFTTDGIDYFITGTYEGLAIFDGIPYYSGPTTNYFLMRINKNSWLLNTIVPKYKNNRLINIYPNPTSSDLYINLNGYSIGPLINIYDLSGQIVRTISYSGENTLSIDISDLKDGIYFIQLVTKDNKQTFKIIKISK